MFSVSSTGSVASGSAVSSPSFSRAGLAASLGRGEKCELRLSVRPEPFLESRSEPRFPSSFRDRSWLERRSRSRGLGVRPRSRPWSSRRSPRERSRRSPREESRRSPREESRRSPREESRRSPREESLRSPREKSLLGPSDRGLREPFPEPFEVAGEGDLDRL